MDKHGKVWGSTQNLFFKNNVEISRIQINKRGCCSKHKHEHKYNMFFVEIGKLKIKIWKNDYNLIDETILESQQSTTVKPGEYHTFEALEDTIAYEIYWIELCVQDIIRETCGEVKS
jgi:mannose-6-phosphate isomerase-like protein (cupin superfamily)